MEKSRLEVATLTKQLMGERIDQEMYESLLAPVNHLLAQLEKDIAVLKEQEKVEEERDQFGEWVRAALSKYSDSLDDFEDKRATFSAFGVKVQATRDEMSITVVVDPKVTT